MGNQGKQSVMYEPAHIQEKNNTGSGDVLMFHREIAFTGCSLPLFAVA